MEQRQQFNQILRHIAESLDIPISKYELAKKRYTAVGKWLEDGYYVGMSSIPEIYVQGSFRLGTVVRPITEEDEYDIDLVCQLNISKQNLSPIRLKKIIGDRLKSNKDYARMMDKEGRRCWTLNYAEDSDGVRFHMDILPAIPDDDSWKHTLISKHGIPDQYAAYAIAITNKERINNSYDWLRSNPRGYADWFDNTKQPVYTQIETQEKLILIERHGDIYVSIEDVPNEIIKTPLQRVIQILKRHRDIWFQKNPENKPISMIITTLSALAYDNETELFLALINIIDKIEHYVDTGLIEKRIGQWWIPNPVDPLENFADKWNENPALPSAFFKWVEQLKYDFNNALKQKGLHKIAESLSPVIGQRSVADAFERLGTSYTENRKRGVLKTAVSTGVLSAGSGAIKNPDHTFHGPHN